MTPATLSLSGRRNAAYPPQVYRMEIDGVAVSLSGKTFAMDVRVTAGQEPALISLDTAPDDTSNGVRAVDAVAGRFRVQIDQATMQAAWDAAYADGVMKAGEAAPLVYRLLVIGSDGIAEAWLEGDFIIEAGVTL